MNPKNNMSWYCCHAIIVIIRYTQRIIYYDCVIITLLLWIALLISFLCGLWPLVISEETVELPIQALCSDSWEDNRKYPIIVIYRLRSTGNHTHDHTILFAIFFLSPSATCLWFVLYHLFIAMTTIWFLPLLNQVYDGATHSHNLR